MERLPGQPLAGTPLSRTQTAALGRALRRLYDVPLDALTAAGIQERINGPTDHAATVAIWLSHSPDLAACRDPDLVGRAIQTALRWLAQSDPPPPPRLETLGIADLNPANVVWDGETCRLVDFEDGGLTEPAYELADHVEHLAGRLTRSFDPVGLVAAVGLSADDQRRMRAYRPLWAAFWLAMLLPGNRGFDRNPPGTTELQAAHLLALLDGRFSRS